MVEVQVGEEIRRLALQALDRLRGLGGFRLGQERESGDPL